MTCRSSRREHETNLEIISSNNYIELPVRWRFEKKTERSVCTNSFTLVQKLYLDAKKSIQFSFSFYFEQVKWISSFFFDFKLFFHVRIDACVQFYILCVFINDTSFDRLWS